MALYQVAPGAVRGQTLIPAFGSDGVEDLHRLSATSVPMPSPSGARVQIC